MLSIRDGLSSIEISASWNASGFVVAISFAHDLTTGANGVAIAVAISQNAIDPPRAGTIWMSARRPAAGNRALDDYCGVPIP
jgi:hypothetical protein